MPLEYTVYSGTSSKKYNGFTRYKMGEVPDGCQLVIVNFDGDLELWIVEKNGLKNLRAYYQDEWGKNRSIPLQQFNCSGVEKNFKADKWF